MIRPAWWLLLACAGASPARAAATTCTLTPTSAVFGSYDPASTTALSVIATGTINCTYTGTGFDATLTLSTGSSGSYAPRTLVLGTHKLNYNVYLDPAHTAVLGNGSSGTYAITICFAGGTFTCPGGGGTSGVTLSAPIYGMLPGGQDVPAGTYSDTLVLTITY
jgi:spore coat protein U-like protein